MSTRNRSQDLTAELLQDIAEEQPVPAASAPVDAIDPSPSAFVETALFLAPRTWRRPRIGRSATTLSLSAGPVQVRIGRG